MCALWPRIRFTRHAPAGSRANPFVVKVEKQKQKQKKTNTFDERRKEEREMTIFRPFYFGFRVVCCRLMMLAVLLHIFPRVVCTLYTDTTLVGRPVLL